MSNMKTNLKFVMGSNRLNKLISSKNMNTSGSEFVSTINISTNSKVKDKLAQRKITESKPTKNENKTSQNTNPSSENISVNKRNKLFDKYAEIESNKSGPNIPFIPIDKESAKLHSTNKVNNQSPELNLKDLRSFHKDSFGKDGYINYNSNSSNRSYKNSNQEEKKISKHHKNISEIPPSFRNVPAFTENNTGSEKSKEREIFDKSNLDPAILKTKSQRMFAAEKDKIVVKQFKYKDSPVAGKKRDSSLKVKLSSDERNNHKNKFNKEDNDNYNDNDKGNGNYSIYEEKKYQDLLAKYREQEKTIKELIITSEILKSYIKSYENNGESFKSKLNEKFIKKEQEILLLKDEKTSILKENKELKLLILKIIYGIKLFEDTENHRESQFNLKNENDYLRIACEGVIGNLTYLNKKASSHNDNQEADKFDNKQKAFHKRQKTHININHIQNLELNIDEINKDSETNSSIITIVGDEKQMANNQNNNNQDDSVISTMSDNSDLFEQTIKNINMNKTLKRKNPNLKTEKNDGYLTNPLSPSNGKPKPVYLFYRTPSNKDKKKINFSENK